ncbi:MAG: ABC transporter permease, partial [Achromobacter pestifer]
MSLRLPRPVRYLLQILFVVGATAIANFFLLKLVPGDLVDVIASENSGITPEHVAELRVAYGLDQSVLAQLGYYLKSLLSLDLGYSFRYGEPVA